MSSKPDFRVVEVSVRYHYSTDAAIGLNYDMVEYFYTQKYAEKIAAKLSDPEIYDQKCFVEKRFEHILSGWARVYPDHQPEIDCEDIPF